MWSVRNTGMVQEKKSSKWLRPIETIGLILDEDGLEPMAHLKRFCQEIGVQPKNVEILVYLPKKHQLGEFDGVKLTPAGINWLGKFKSQEVKEFISRSFDMLLCYQRDPDKVLDKLVSSSMADFKVGRLEGSTRVFDLAVAADHKDLTVFTEEVKKYLKILNRLG